MSGPTPRPGLLDVTPYSGGKGDLDGHAEIIRLASNESALGPSPRALAAYEAAGADLHRYPDGGHDDLRRTLATHFGLDAARIVCGAGSDELITLLTRAYAGPDDEVVISQYGFLMYRINAVAVAARPVMAPETNLTTDVDAVLACVGPRTRLIFIANPNNPTGSYVTREAMRRLQAGLPDRVLLVIDAAYSEFVSRNDYSPGIELVAAAENVVMLRTFSKIHGLAALRLGWAYCPPAVADILQRLRSPFNVTAPGLAAGVAAIEDIAHADAARTHNDVWLPRMERALTALGLEVAPGVCNFVLVRFPGGDRRDAAAAEKYLMVRGIIPRAMAGYGLPDRLRITIGLDRENEAVIAALTEFMA